MKYIFRSAVTLVELLISIGIVSILASVVIIAINPAKQIGEALTAADTVRKNTIRNGLNQYFSENSDYPSVINSTPQMICSQGFSLPGCISLEGTVTPIYMAEVPQRQSVDTPNSGYYAYIGSNGNVQVATVEDLEAEFRIEQRKRAVSFDGVNDQIVFAEDTVDFDAKDFSVALWFKTTDTQFRLFDTRGTGSIGSQQGIQISSTDGSSWANIVLEDGSNYVRFSGVPYTQNDDAWHHLVVTYDASAGTAELYIDNALMDTQTNASLIGSDIGSTSGHPLTFGGEAGGSNQDYDGELFDVRVYSKTLTSDEVTHVYSFGSTGLDPETTNLTLHAKLDDTNPMYAYDSSGNGNHGTKANITESTFHYSGNDVPYSWQNEVGYTLAQNTLLYSEDFTQSEWTRSNMTASGTTVAPDGSTITMWAFTNAYMYQDSSETTAGEEATNSIWIKANKDTTLGIRIPGGTNANTDNIDVAVSTNWQQYTVTDEAISTNGRLLVDSRSTYGYGDTDLAVAFWKPHQYTAESGFSNFSKTSSADAYGYIPRDESNPTYDVLGNELQYSGPAQNVPGGAQVLLSDNLRNRWTFSEGTGSSSDDEIESNTMSFSGDTTFSTDVPNATLDYSLEFDGTGDYADPVSPYPGFLHDAFTTKTITTWVKVTGDGGGTPQIIFEEGGGTNAIALFYRSDANTLNYVTAQGSTDVELETTTIVEPSKNEWVHVALVYDNGAMRFYVNGALEDSGSNGTSIPTHTGQPRFGGLIDSWPISGSSYNFQGRIADFRIYEDVLADSEIYSIYNAQK